MKTKLLIIIYTVILIFSACKPDEYQLGELYSKNDLRYRIYQNPDDSNMVILESLTPNATPYWIHPQGYSTRVKDTLKFPFPGKYAFVYGVLSPGGLVQADTFYLEINTTNLMYVSDSLWIYLTGGPGNEKIWLLDIDENGVSKYFNGPCYWMSAYNGWHYECMAENPTDCWYWEASYAGNEWMGEKGNHGTMTFSLKGGAYVTVDHKLYPELGLQNGTFDFNVNKKTIKFTNAIPLIIKNSWSLNELDFSTEMRIVSLTKNSLQIGVKHKTKSEYMIFNFISKEYSDNWVPPVQEDPNFDFGIKQKDALTVSNSRTWKFDLNVPYNWTDLNGNFLNNWNTRQDIINTGWAPYNDNDTVNIDDIRITFYANGTVRIKNDDGTILIGTYTLDEKTNILTFIDVKPEFWIAGWVTATTTADNKWKIVKVEKDSNGYVIGIWFGKRAEDKKEYMVYHFIAAD